MPGRTFSSTSYRYGFNGQEKSDDIKGAGNSYTAEFWEYDPRLGRRWNLDPIINESMSGYECFSNNPINNVDLHGDSDSSATAHSLSNSQLLSGVTLAFDEIQKAIKGGTALFSTDVGRNLQSSIDKFAENNNLTLEQYKDFRTAVYQYHYGFQLMALWKDGAQSLAHLGTTLNNSKYADNFKVQAAEVHIRPYEKRTNTLKTMVWDAAVMMNTTSRMASYNMTGSNGPRSPSNVGLKYSYMNAAINAQNKAIGQVSLLSKTQQGNISMMITGVNLRTGQIAVGYKFRNTGNSFCAEDEVLRQLGGNAREIFFSQPYRPRTGLTQPVCERCQTKFQPWQFIEGTQFK